MTDDQLSALCQAAPSATVAYYSGDEHTKGTLVVYAKDGHRLPAIIERYGGNTVDLNALRWLLAQPAPWILMSDLGFCDDSTQAISEAMALVKCNPIQVVEDIEQTLRAFQAMAEEQAKA